MKRSRPIIYDVGMNNGDDSDFYLKKGFDVVGIDANPKSCASCEERFAREIRAGRMRVLNVGVGEVEEERPFFVNPDDPLSTFLPDEWERGERDWRPSNDWTSVMIRIQKLSSIIREYGDPFYVKIDVEHFDHLVLYDLLWEGIAPPYISVEAQTIDVYCILVAMRYEEFKVQRGCKISTANSNRVFHDLSGQPFAHQFSSLSSGPFGEDVPGSWLNKLDGLSSLLDVGLGWVDLHARSAGIAVGSEGVASPLGAAAVS